MTRRMLTAALALALFRCSGRPARNDRAEGRQNETANAPVAWDQAESAASPRLSEETDETEMINPASFKSRPARMLDSLGYINIETAYPEIVVEIVYHTPDNFVGEVLYEELNEAYLLPEAAEKLYRAQQHLQAIHPRYRLIVYDAARPMSVQRKMWEVAVKTGKQYYVSNPANGGGLHNYGAAVDLSILDENGIPLSMGTVFDHLGPEANIDREAELVAEGIITEQQRLNRLLLRKVMTDAGFTTVKSEWWHFNHCSREYARKNYPVIDF